MGLFGKLFEKKECDICGGEIGLLGNRKLEDGNLCKNCASKLSPFFSDRRRSTIQEIKEQLDYREANQEEVEKFHTTLTIGEHTKILFDEDQRKFMVTSARNLKEANPDVISYADVTGCKVDVDESKTELKREDKDGNEVSFNPPRYECSYSFTVIINVNNPYFDEIRFRLNNSSVKVTPPVATFREGSTTTAIEYARKDVNFAQYQEMGDQIVEQLTSARRQIREEVEAAAAPKVAVTCPFCRATTFPDASGRCEYCGGVVNG